MANTIFPKNFYFELRYKGEPCVPFSDGLTFYRGDGTSDIPFSQYRQNGSVTVYAISCPNWTTLEPITINGIKGCTESSGSIEPSTNYDYSYDSSVPTYYLEVTPASAYTCIVYTGDSIANTVSSATVEIRYDGNGVTYTGASDYVITVTTNTSGSATLKWFSGSPTVVAWKGNSAGTKTAAISTSENFIQLTAQTSTDKTYYYKGYVKDDGGNPLAGAGVIFEYGNVVFTDSTGMFSESCPDVLDPGPISATIVTKDYIPYSGTVASCRGNSSSINTYVLDSPDTIVPYDVPDDKVLTLYDMWNLMSDQWHRLNQGLNGKTATLDLDKCRDVFSAVTKAYYYKDDSNSPDFSTQSSGYCLTALYTSNPISIYVVPNAISFKLLGYQYDNARKLFGVSEDIFGFSYDYGRCNPYRTVKFPELKFTYNLSYVKATFETKKTSGIGIVQTLSAVTWAESIDEGACELASGGSLTTSISQAANKIEPIPYMDSGTIPIRWTVNFNQTAENVTFSTSNSVFDAGNDNFTLTNYTVNISSSTSTTITIDGTIKLEGFENKFAFKIPVS